jgi:hypothetical protein
MFKAMVVLGRQHPIKDYAVSQSTLEQVRTLHTAG